MRRVKSGVRDTLLVAASQLPRRSRPSVSDVVLIFQPDHLGDILLSQPAVRFLRDRFPASRLVAVVGPWAGEITTMAWPVDEIVLMEFPGFTRAARRSPIEPYLQLRSESRRLAPFSATSSYILRPDAWWAAWLASLISPEVVTANHYQAARFATTIADIGEAEHASVRSFQISAGGRPISSPTWETSPLTLAASEPAADEADRLLRTHDVSTPFAVIHPGSGAPVKEWPVHRWRTVIDHLTQDGHRVIVTGSTGEAGICSELVGRSPHCTSLAGQTSVPVLAELLRRATVVLGPDCGPLHVAVATGTPTVHLFGPSDPRRYGPWGDPRRHQVVTANWRCPRCGDLSPERTPGCGCMLAIDPRDVITAVRSVLAQHAN